MQLETTKDGSCCTHFDMSLNDVARDVGSRAERPLPNPCASS